MKIVQVCPRYYPHIGGVEYVVKSIAERLAKLGHEVTLLAGEPGIAKPEEEFINGVRVVRWPTWSPREAYHFPKKKGELEKLLKELARNADVVHVHSIHSILTVFSGLRIGTSLHDAKLIVTSHYHGSGHTTLRRLLWVYWRHKVSSLLSHADAIHVVSRRELSLINAHYPHVRGKIAVVPNGVEEDVLNYRWQGQNSNYLIYAGRVEKYKMLEVAIGIAKMMGLKLLIVGRGSYRGRLAKHASKVYREGVEFLEPQPREKYLELLSKARYAINPSKHEAYSIFIAEALAIGTPAIVSSEIAENLMAQTKPFFEKLVIAEKALVRTWSEIVELYLKNLYAV